jgi:hypothetical protein
MISWVLANDVKTIAMENTGTYWQNLFATLQNAGLGYSLQWKIYKEHKRQKE